MSNPLPEPTAENVALIRALAYCPACSAAAGTPCSDPMFGRESLAGVHAAERGFAGVVVPETPQP